MRRYSTGRVGCRFDSCILNARLKTRGGTMSSANPEIPAEAPVKGGLVAYLTVDGAMKAAEFYVRAFGARSSPRCPSTTRDGPCMSTST